MKTDQKMSFYQQVTTQKIQIILLNAQKVVVYLVVCFSDTRDKEKRD